VTGGEQAPAKEACLAQFKFQKLGFSHR
jgi:hypothetical protein